MNDSYEDDKMVYDISDRAARLLGEFNKLSKVIDPNSNLPNSLQAILGKVYRYEGKTQRDIASIYQMDYQNTVKYISELQQRRLIHKIDIDSKRKGIYLTKEGHRINDHLMSQRGRIIAEVLEVIPKHKLLDTKETLDDIIKIFEKILKNM